MRAAVAGQNRNVADIGTVADQQGKFTVAAPVESEDALRFEPGADAEDRAIGAAKFGGVEGNQQRALP